MSTFDPSTDPALHNPPNLHPEDYCHRCAGPNMSWYTSHNLFNLANGGPDGIICPICFDRLHKRATGEETTWAIYPSAHVEQLTSVVEAIRDLLVSTNDPETSDEECERRWDTIAYLLGVERP